MSGNRPFTMVRGLSDLQPLVSASTGDMSCYVTDDGASVLLLAGDRSEMMERLGETMGPLRPGVSVLDHYCTITAEPRRPAFGPGAGSRFQLLIALATVAEQQRPLADYNVAETVSTLQHMPGFYSATFFLERDLPVVHELVAWQSEEHLDAARGRPEFIRHMSYLSAAARTSWNRLEPLAADAP